LAVAVCASRLGSKVSLISAVASDPFHAMIRGKLQLHGINTDHVITCQGYNGTYFTSPDYKEDREYLHHRPGTAAQHITPALVFEDLIDNTKIVYASSEMQSVSKAARQAVFKAFNIADDNAMVAYDPNLRLRLWSLEDAKECLWSILPFIDVMLPSAPEETKALFGYERPLDVIGYLFDRGVNIVVVKMGSGGCMVGYDKKVKEYPLPQFDGVPHNLTLIGSAFNGAFLHAMARGFEPFEAAQFANNVALFKSLKKGGMSSLPTKDDVANKVG